MSSPKHEILAPGIEIYCGDCLEILPTLEAGSVDVVVTDPPYGIAYKTNYRSVMKTPEVLTGDALYRVDSVELMANRIKEAGALYLATRFDVISIWQKAIEDSGLSLKTPVVWDKCNWTAGDLVGDFGAQVEILLFAHKGRHQLKAGRPSNLWRISRDGASEHPTPKPVALMGRAIECSSLPDDLILDPFMGSGTTGVAAVRLGRKFIGIEIDPQYYAIAKQRIVQAIEEREMDMFKGEAII